MGLRKGYTTGRAATRKHNTESFHKVYERLIHQNLVIPVHGGLDKIRPHPHSLAVVTDSSNGCLFIRREPFSRSFYFDDNVYILGHKPSQLTAYLNPSRFCVERDSTELNFSLPSTLAHADASLKLSLSQSDTLTSLEKASILDDMVTMSFDRTQLVPNEPTEEANQYIAPPCTFEPSTKSVLSSHAPTTPVLKAPARPAPSLVREKQTGNLASSMHVYCIPPPPPRIDSKKTARCTRSATCSPRRRRLLDALDHSIHRQAPPENESFDEVSLLLGDPSDASSLSNGDLHSDPLGAAIDKSAREETEKLRQKKNMHYLRHSRAGMSVYKSPSSSCTVRDFGFREYSRRVVPHDVRQSTRHPPDAASDMIIASSSRLLSPIKASSVDFSKDTTTSGIIYEHLVRSALPSESVQQRLPVSQPAFANHIPITPIVAASIADSTQPSSLPAKEYDMRLSPLHQQPVKPSLDKSLDKSMSMATLFSSLPNMNYTRSNLSQQERIARIFGPQTINKERTRAIKDIMAFNEAVSLPSPLPSFHYNPSATQSSDLLFATETGLPLPPDGSPSLSSSHRKRLTYSLSNVMQQKSQIANYTHFETRSRSSPLQAKDLSVDNIYRFLRHDKSQHMQHDQSLPSPFHNLYQSTKFLDKVLSPFTLPKHANRAISAPAEPGIQDYKFGLVSSPLSQFTPSTDHHSLFARCLDLNALSEEATSLTEVVEPLDDLSSSASQKVHLHLDLGESANTKTAMAVVQQAAQKVVPTDAQPRRLLMARNALKQPPRTARKRSHPLLPSEMSSDEPNSGLLTGDNAIIITDTSDITQTFPSSDHLSDAHVGYGISAEFHSPEKGRVIPQTPRNETVKLGMTRAKHDGASSSNQLVHDNVEGSLAGSPGPSNVSLISTPTRSTGPSRAYSFKRSTLSILPPTAALESIRNSNYAIYDTAGAHIMRASTTGNIYFRSSTPTGQDMASPSQYIMHPERHRVRSTLASSKKTSDPDRTSMWSSRTSDISMSYAEYKSIAKGTLAVPRLPKYLRYNEFYLERMAEYGRAPVDASDMDYTGSSHQQRSGSESDEHSSLADLSWNTQYYLMNPSSHKKTIEEVYKLASRRPNNVLKKFLEERRTMTRRRARFRFDIIYIVAKVQVQTAPDGTTSRRVIFDVC